jgi:hypothetical protein
VSVFTEDVVARIAREAVRLNPDDDYRPRGRPPLIGREVELAEVLRVAEEAHNEALRVRASLEKHRPMLGQLADDLLNVLKAWRALDEDTRRHFAWHAFQIGADFGLSRQPSAASRTKPKVDDYEDYYVGYASVIDNIKVTCDRVFGDAYHTAEFISAVTTLDSGPQKSRSGLPSDGLIAMAGGLKKFWEDRTNTSFGQEFYRLRRGDELVPVSGAARLFYYSAVQINSEYTTAMSRQVMIEVQHGSGSANFGNRHLK